MLKAIPLPQADEPERQQAAEFGAPFDGGHPVGRQRIGAFHVSWPCSVVDTEQKPLGRPGWDIS
jgi:hypothetical protein